VVDPVVAVRTLLLQQALPDVPLRPGASVVARVASRGESGGVLVLAGVPLTAQLPDDVASGSTLRLKVREVTPERVTLQLDGPPIPPAGAEAPPLPPREASARVAVGEPPRRRVQDGEEVASVALSFASELLGRLDLRIELRSGSVQVTVEAPAGEVQALAQGEADRLRDGLAVSIEREATVHVRPRREPVDLYA
jgi:hypothetical protein